MPGRILELVSRAHLRWKRSIARNLLPYGVNSKQLFLLRKLKESGGLAPSEIAELLFSDRPTVTSMLRTLENAGWISRRRDPTNGKRVIVEITATGEEKLHSIPLHLWRTGKMAPDPEASLSPSERSTLVRLLEKLNQALDCSEHRAP